MDITDIYVKQIKTKKELYTRLVLTKKEIQFG